MMHHGLRALSRALLLLAPVALGAAALAAPGLADTATAGPSASRPVGWTAVGADGDTHVAWMGDRGGVEVGTGSFTLEPFAFRDGKLLDGVAATHRHSLLDGDLPIPTVSRRHDGLRVDVTAFSIGARGSSTLYVRYRLRSERAGPLRFFVALLPESVRGQAPGQGVGPLASATLRRETVRTGGRRVVARMAPTFFGAMSPKDGRLLDFLSRGRVPPGNWAGDEGGHVSAALAWDLELPAGEPTDLWLAVPSTPASRVVASRRRPDGAPVPRRDGVMEMLLEQARRQWRASLDRVGVHLPPPAALWEDALHASLVDSVLLARVGRSDAEDIESRADWSALLLAEPGARVAMAEASGCAACSADRATSLLREGRRDEALRLLTGVLDARRPEGWNRWPRSSAPGHGRPAATPFVRALRSMLVYEEAAGDGAAPTRAVVGAGVPLGWLLGGELRLDATPTRFGALWVRMRMQTHGDDDGRRVVLELDASPPAGSDEELPPDEEEFLQRALRDGATGLVKREAPRGFEMPPGGMRVASPLGAAPRAARVGGQAVTPEAGMVVVSALPARVVFEYDGD